MIIYKNKNDWSTIKIDDNWVETEDEIVNTPIGAVLKSYTQTEEYKNNIQKIHDPVITGQNIISDQSHNKHYNNTNNQTKDLFADVLYASAGG